MENPLAEQVFLCYVGVFFMPCNYHPISTPIEDLVKSRRLLYKTGLLHPGSFLAYLHIAKAEEKESKSE
jgi:hypothetical protein